MADRFSQARPRRRTSNSAWFRLGEHDIGSASLLALLCAISIVVYGLEPRDKPILRSLWLDPSKVFEGQVWRVVSWPLANGFDQELLWTAVTVGLVWYFGTRLEVLIGRVPMAKMLVAIIVLSGIAGTILDLPQAGVRSVELAILLIFVAENPHMKFLFGIPAWVLGVIYVATDILQFTGAGATRQLLFYAVSLITAALAARSVGLLTAFTWIPRFAGYSGSTAAKTPRRDHRPVRSAMHKRKSGAVVVNGPWSPPPFPVDDSQLRLDALLDKISATGLDSLTADEKQLLNDLSRKRD